MRFAVLFHQHDGDAERVGVVQLDRGGDFLAVELASVVQVRASLVRGVCGRGDRPPSDGVRTAGFGRPGDDTEGCPASTARKCDERPDPCAGDADELVLPTHSPYKLAPDEGPQTIAELKAALA
ncbi:hypothetical protein [Streptomyces jumonjinensis]|uniref:hypothetical protein n=1 Tax=Streptomyces jumonjinensis TaxID=1945 RepID=UPI0037A23F57